MSFQNIRIVLVKTWHSGNIGATARAMKNMGLSQLFLVDPVDFPSAEATARAGQATDILNDATVVATLADAIADCSLVVATSARDRSIGLPALCAEDCAKKAVQEAKASKVAIVFGRERTGLLNEEIQQCHFQLNIAANPEYPVLNISQAVQLVCYEIFKAGQTLDMTSEQTTEPYPLHAELALLQAHLKETAQQTGFLNPQHEGHTLAHFNALLRRARLTKKELSIFRGFLSAVQRTNDAKGGANDATSTDER